MASTDLSQADLSHLLAWEQSLDVLSYYELLGVLEVADESDIRQQFREFCRAFHPDSHPHGGSEVANRLERIFQRGAEAYRVLMNPELRASYDLGLARGRLRLGAEAPSVAPRNQIRTLDELCQSAGGKLHARRADKLISEGDLERAKRELLLAWRSEEQPDPELADRLDALDLALFARGA
ncbi:MAG TPA: J domain-containing protein [Polyangiaceae bacterium]|nr:J domain-containing protein [Polyangiaceae bacterium]